MLHETYHDPSSGESAEAIEEDCCLTYGAVTVVDGPEINKRCSRRDSLIYAQLVANCSSVLEDGGPYTIKRFNRGRKELMEKYDNLKIPHGRTITRSENVDWKEIIEEIGFEDPEGHVYTDGMLRETHDNVSKDIGHHADRADYIRYKREHEDMDLPGVRTMEKRLGKQIWNKNIDVGVDADDEQSLLADPEFVRDFIEGTII